MKRFYIQSFLLLMTVSLLLAESVPRSGYAQSSPPQSSPPQSSPPQSSPPQSSPPALRLSTMKSAELLQQSERYERPYYQYFQDVQDAEGVRFQANFPLSGVSALVYEIENLERDLQAYLGLPGRKELVEVLMFDSESHYASFLRKEFPDAPNDRRALFIKKNGMPGIVLIRLTEGTNDDIRHEMTHAFLHASYSYVPLWLDEGLAEYFELPANKRADGKSYLKNPTNNNLVFSSVPSLRKLEKIKNVNEFGAREYRESWAWIHFLIHNSPITHKILAGYLAQVGSGQPTDTLENYLKKSVPDIKQEYFDHFKGWKNRNKTADTESPKEAENISRGWKDSFFR